MLAQRRDGDGDDVQAVVEILAKLCGPDGLLKIFVGGGEDSGLEGNGGRVPPTRSNSLCCRTRRSFACMGGASSPISSRKRVPSSAASSFPFLRPTAPVNAPFSCPKSSLSRRVSGMAAQLMAMKGRPERGLFWWMARATNSLPVPLSPRMRTVESLCATRAMNSSIWLIWRLSPTS